ncbi:MAG: DUF1579 family protein [Candidatus Korobacteraceae bacterium]
MPRMYFALACVLLLTVVALSAPAQMPVPKPAPELSKLDFLAGNWASDSDLKPGPMGPGGKITATDNVQWMDGKFFLVMHSKFGGAMGDGMELSIFGYDPEHKVYTYSSYNSWGEAGRSTGTVNGDTWTWISDDNMGSQPFKGRYTMKVLSPSSYAYKYEMSKDGTSWTTVMNGKATKTK